MENLDDFLGPWVFHDNENDGDDIHHSYYPTKGSTLEAFDFRPRSKNIMVRQDVNGDLEAPPASYDDFYSHTIYARIPDAAAGDNLLEVCYVRIKEGLKIMFHELYWQSNVPTELNLDLMTASEEKLKAYVESQPNALSGANKPNWQCRKPD